MIILRERQTMAVFGGRVVAVGHKKAHERLFVDRLRQQRKGERTLLLFEVDVCDLVIIL